MLDKLTPLQFHVYKLMSFLLVGHSITRFNYKNQDFIQNDTSHVVCRNITSEIVNGELRFDTVSIL